MNPTDTLKVTVMQMRSTDHIESNMAWIFDAFEKIRSEKPQLVCLPENCLFFRIREGDKIPFFTLDHPIFNRFSELASKRNLHIHLGSVPLLLNNKKYNSSVLIDPCGKIQANYQKIHLFDIQLEGRPPLRESETFSPGENPQTFQIGSWKIGESICYDIRFAELYLQYAKQAADILLIPAAFLVETGLAHWEILVRARAIESQAFVIASAQGGTHQGQKGSLRETYGHSLIVGPWGDIKGQLQNVPGLMTFELNRQDLIRTRNQIPMQDHRRI